VTFLAGRTLSAQRRLRAGAMDADLGRGARESEGHDFPRGVEPAVPGSRWSSDRCCQHRTSSLCAIRLSAESSNRLLPWPTWTTASGPAAISSPAVWNLRRRHDWASGLRGRPAQAFSMESASRSVAPFQVDHQLKPLDLLDRKVAQPAPRLTPRL